MIKCNKCDAWFHLNVEERFIKNEDVPWFCSKCLELRKQAVTFKELQASLTENMTSLIDIIHGRKSTPFSDALRLKKGRHHQRVIANTFGCAHKALTQDEIEKVLEKLDQLINTETSTSSFNYNFRMGIDVLFPEVYIQALIKKTGTSYQDAIVHYQT